MDQREWDYGARMSRDRRAAEAWPVPETEIRESEPRWASLTDTGSMTPSPEALTWQARADAWAQQSDLEPYSGGGGQAIEPANRWTDVTSTGRPAFPADGVGWRSQTAEWRATGARWRQTTEWRSSTGSHVWRSTTEAWQDGEEGTETPGRPTIAGTAWATSELDSGRESTRDISSTWSETPSWQRDADPGRAATTPVEQTWGSPSTPSWQQPSAQTPSWQQPDQTPSWQQPSQTPSWQQPSAQSPSWQQPDQSPSWQQPSQTPSWQQPGQSSSWQQSAQAPSWQQSSSPTPPRQRAADSWSPSAPAGGYRAAESAAPSSAWDSGRLSPGENTTDVTGWDRSGGPGWQAGPRDDGRHFVREDDRAAWQRADDEWSTRRGRRRAPEPDGQQPSGGTGWSGSADTDNWAGHADTGSIQLSPGSPIADPGPPAPSWGSRSARRNYEAEQGYDDRSGRGYTAEQGGAYGERGGQTPIQYGVRPDSARRAAPEDTPAGASGRIENAAASNGLPGRQRGDDRRAQGPQRYNANPTNWREDTASWDPEKDDTSNWTRDPDTGQWSRAEEDPRVLAWRAEAARREQMKQEDTEAPAQPTGPSGGDGRRGRRDDGPTGPVGGVQDGPRPRSAMPSGGWSNGEMPGPATPRSGMPGGTPWNGADQPEPTVSGRFRTGQPEPSSSGRFRMDQPEPTVSGRFYTGQPEPSASGRFRADQPEPGPYPTQRVSPDAYGNDSGRRRAPEDDYPAESWRQGPMPPRQNPPRELPAGRSGWSQAGPGAQRELPAGPSRWSESGAQPEPPGRSSWQEERAPRQPGYGASGPESWQERDPRQSGYGAADAYGARDARGAGDPRDAREPYGARDPRGAGDPRDAREPYGARDPRGAGDPRDTREPYGSRQPYGDEAESGRAARRAGGPAYGGPEDNGQSWPDTRRAGAARELPAGSSSREPSYGMRELPAAPQRRDDEYGEPARREPRKPAYGGQRALPSGPYRPEQENPGFETDRYGNPRRPDDEDDPPYGGGGRGPGDWRGPGPGPGPSRGGGGAAAGWNDSGSGNGGYRGGGPDGSGYRGGPDGSGYRGGPDGSGYRGGAPGGGGFRGSMDGPPSGRPVDPSGPWRADANGASAPVNGTVTGAVAPSGGAVSGAVVPPGGDWRAEFNGGGTAVSTAPVSGAAGYRTAAAPNSDWRADMNGGGGSAAPVSGYRAAAAPGNDWRADMGAAPTAAPVSGAASYRAAATTTTAAPVSGAAGYRAAATATTSAAPVSGAAGYRAAATATSSAAPVSGAAGYRAAATTTTTAAPATDDWRRELARDSGPADGEPQRFSTSDFPPFRPSGSAAVSGETNLALSATSVISVPPAAAPAAAPEEDTTWPPRRAANGAVAPQEDTSWPPRGAVNGAAALQEDTSWPPRRAGNGAADLQEDTSWPPRRAGNDATDLQEDTSWPPRRAVSGALFENSGSYERRPVSNGLLSGSQNDLLNADDEDEAETSNSPLAAVGYTVVWYGVPAVLFIVGIFLLNSGQRSHALQTLADAAPEFGISLTLSIMVAFGLRFATTAWKSASVGLAAAVVGGGLATVLSSAITGNSLS
ncbi:hypothetical protein Areg01_28700 [Actinoplanes regularis]|nr:hypothetical protein Areg01_28700 [Actinoplanes regularis]